MNYHDKAKSIEQNAIKSIAPLRDKRYINQCVKELSHKPILIDFSTESWTKNIPQTYGVYLFWVNFTKMNNEISVLKNEWETAKEEVKFTPRFNQTRAREMAAALKEDAKIPFYLGKAEKMCSRIKQHVFLDAKSGTYALKLNAIRNSNKNIHALDFEVSFLTFPFNKKSIFLLEIIESALRNALNPVIGRQ